MYELHDNILYAPSAPGIMRLEFGSHIAFDSTTRKIQKCYVSINYLFEINQTEEFNGCQKRGRMLLCKLEVWFIVYISFPCRTVSLTLHLTNYVKLFSKLLSL